MPTQRLMLPRALASVWVATLLALAPQIAGAQSQGVPRPSPVETAPLPAPGGTPAAPVTPPATAPSGGGVTLSQDAPPPGAPPVAAPAPSPAGRPTLVPTPGDPLDVAEVTLPGKPAAILSGKSTWEEGFDNLKNAFAKIEAELARAGIAPAGRPITAFLETDDDGFRYDAMIPIERAPEGRAGLGADIRFGRTAQGKAYHFVHKGSYEDIDSTYETITAYLDSKGIVANDVFIEEYVTDLADKDDDNLEINIFVQPR